MAAEDRLARGAMPSRKTDGQTFANPSLSPARVTNVTLTRCAATVPAAASALMIHVASRRASWAMVRRYAPALTRSANRCRRSAGTADRERLMVRARTSVPGRRRAGA